MTGTLKKHFYFRLNESKSPTYHNISRCLNEKGWHSTRFNWRANFSEKNFEFDLAAAETLEYKNLLAKLISQYCPTVSPITYCINDHNWPTTLSTIANQFYRKDNLPLEHVENLVWILKPALLNNGQHIKIFQRLSEIEQHYLRSDRLGGEHVLQQYITSPHLLRGHKYSIRMFVVLTNYAGAFLYPHGYFNVSLQPYQSAIFDNLGPHLTNEHLTDEAPNVVQIPSEKFDIFPLIYKQIKNIVTETIHGLKQSKPKAFVDDRMQTLAIFGFDFMVDSDQRVWLLEANHGPCFPVQAEHPLQKHVYYDFWQAFINSFVIPIATKKSLNATQYQSFESLS